MTKLLTEALKIRKALDAHEKFLEELKGSIRARITIKTEIMGEDYIDTSIKQFKHILNTINKFQAQLEADDNV